MATHRRPKIRQTASTELASPAVESTTALIPIITGTEAVGTAPSVPIRQIFRRFWPETRGFRGRLVFGLLLVGVPPLLSAVGIWLFKILVDDVLANKDLARFPYIAAAFVAITLAEGVVGFVDEYLTAWVGERFVLNLRSRVFDHLQRLSLTFFEKHQLGDILSRLSGDVGAIEQLILTGINQTLTYLFQIVFFAGALFVLDWRLASAALVAAPAFLLLARIFSRKIKKASQEQRRRSGSINAVAEESLHNTALVQAYHRQDHESARFRRENMGSFAAQMMAIKLEALFAPFTDLLQAAGVLAVVGLGIKELIAGRITLGGLLVFIGYLSQLYGPISGLGNLANSIFAASAGAERVIEVLDTAPEVTDPERPVALRRARGELRVDRVSFRYPESARPAVAEVSFSARPGETVAVVGASGAGKSTLLRILLRLHDPMSGAVTLDGVDLRDLALAELRSNVAVVLQETLVFDGTVADNISWGRPDATLEQVAAAARAADAHQFITGLPQGYQTRIGQRGMMLSGGQRQRIALARAMIRDAPVLLLDEPTTGLDAVSTQRVMAPLRRAMSGRTTIVISHNLLTVTDADRIVYLERGRVAGYGTHHELLATAPGYAELYRLHHPEPRNGAAAVPARRAASAARPTAPARAHIPVALVPAPRHGPAQPAAGSARSAAPSQPAVGRSGTAAPSQPAPLRPGPAAPSQPAAARRPGPAAPSQPAPRRPGPAAPSQPAARPGHPGQPTAGRAGPAARPADPAQPPAGRPGPAARPGVPCRPLRSVDFAPASRAPGSGPAPNGSGNPAAAIRPASPTHRPRPANTPAPTPRPANPPAPTPRPANPPAPTPRTANPPAPTPRTANPPAPTPRTANPSAPSPSPRPRPGSPLASPESVHPRQTRQPYPGAVRTSPPRPSASMPSSHPGPALAAEPHHPAAQHQPLAYRQPGPSGPVPAIAGPPHMPPPHPDALPPRAPRHPPRPGPNAAATNPTPKNLTAPEPPASNHSAPEPTAPKTTAPEPTAPKTTAPEPTAPKTTAPQTTAPKPKPTPKPRPMPRPQPAPPVAPRPRPVVRAVPTPIGRPVPIPRPIAARPAPAPLPIPLPRQALSEVRSVPGWSADEPFGTDEAAR